MSETMTDSERKDMARATIAALPMPRKGQVFRHYKGGLYSIVSVSFLERHPETLFVTYASNRLGGDITRTMEDFLSPVVVEGKTVGRFTWEAD